ncbi:MAG: HAD-IA family hydrolase [Pseudomonadota bacterium]
MQKYILFDLDGTLIDGVDDLVVSINAVLTGLDLPPLQRPAIEAMLGDGMRMLTRRALAAHNVTLAAEPFEAACRKFLEVYEATEYAHTRLYPGVAEILCRLHIDGWKIGLASNKPTVPCNGILRRLGIHDLFTVIAGGDATTVKKPDGGHLRFALELMGYQGTEDEVAVMVGDHANDVDAARAFGIHAIAVAFEVSDARAQTLGADAVVTDFYRLPETLVALLQR